LTNLPIEDASWKYYEVLARHYPQFILEDKNFFEGRGVSGIEDELVVKKKQNNEIKYLKYGQTVSQ
jgi:hypothetical protein